MGIFGSIDLSYNFGNAIAITKSVVTTQFWDVEGRTSRSDFWHYQSIIFLLGLVIGFVSGLILLPIISNVFTLALLAPNIGILVRRMHDLDKAWWFGFIPFYNIYLACLAGTKGPNTFGDDPLGSVAETFS